MRDWVGKGQTTSCVCRGGNKITIQWSRRAARQQRYKYSRTNRTSTRGHLHFPQPCSDVWPTEEEGEVTGEQLGRKGVEGLIALPRGPVWPGWDGGALGGDLDGGAGYRWRSPGRGSNDPLFCWHSSLKGQSSTYFPLSGWMGSIYMGEESWVFNEYLPTSLLELQLGRAEHVWKS